MSETIAIAADHGGFDLKSILIPELRALGYTVLDLGTMSRDAVDYPDFAATLAGAIDEGRATRAALVHDGTSARLARQHNDANVLVLGGRVLGPEVAKDCIKTFFATEFEGGRHARRVAKMS